MPLREPGDRRRVCSRPAPRSARCALGMGSSSGLETPSPSPPCLAQASARTPRLEARPPAIDAGLARAQRLLPHVGGIEEMTRQLALALRARGHEAAVLTNRWPDGVAESELLDGSR